MPTDPETRLSELGLELPSPAAAVANYVPLLRDGDDLYVSGQLPTLAGTLLARGKVGAEVTVDEAYAAARQCALNALSLLREAAGGHLSRVRVLRVGGFVASAPGFTDQPKVVNGASDLFVQVLGEAGRHARAAVGVAELPLGAAVEVEVTARLRPVAEGA